MPLPRLQTLLESLKMGSVPSAGLATHSQGQTAFGRACSCKAQVEPLGWPVPENKCGELHSLSEKKILCPASS